MRRIALLGLTLLLPACQTLADNPWAGNPLHGFGDLIGDTQTYHLNPNRPPGDAPNLLRAEGKQVELEPLTNEPGNVWPGPIAPDPTLQDIQRRQNEEERTGQTAIPVPHGSSTPPGAADTLPPAPATRPPSPTPSPAASPTTQFYPAPGGTAVGTQMGNGVQTYTDPKGGTGIVVPNGNGTSTLIGPDGAVTSVPTPH